jgi:hypothetical protein
MPIVGERLSVFPSKFNQILCPFLRCKQILHRHFQLIYQGSLILRFILALSYYYPLFTDGNLQIYYKQKMQISCFSSIVGELTIGFLMRPMLHKAKFSVDELTVTIIHHSTRFFFL